MRVRVRGHRQRGGTAPVGTTPPLATTTVTDVAHRVHGITQPHAAHTNIVVTQAPSRSVWEATAQQRRGPGTPEVRNRAKAKAVPGEGPRDWNPSVVNTVAYPRHAPLLFKRDELVVRGVKVGMGVSEGRARAKACTDSYHAVLAFLAGGGYHHRVFKRPLAPVAARQCTRVRGLCLPNHTEERTRPCAHGWPHATPTVATRRERARQGEGRCLPHEWTAWSRASMGWCSAVWQLLPGARGAANHVPACCAAHTRTTSGQPTERACRRVQQRCTLNEDTFIHSMKSETDLSTVSI